jgi:hypothetical protein
MCQCHDGLVCDACAAQRIGQIDGSNAGYVELVPGLLTGSDHTDFLTAVNTWTSQLQSKPSEFGLEREPCA